MDSSRGTLRIMPLYYVWCYTPTADNDIIAVHLTSVHISKRIYKTDEQKIPWHCRDTLHISSIHAIWPPRMHFNVRGTNYSEEECQYYGCRYLCDVYDRGNTSNNICIVKWNFNCLCDLIVKQWLTNPAQRGIYTSVNWISIGSCNGLSPFITGNVFWKCHLRNGSHFVQGGDKLKRIHIWISEDILQFQIYRSRLCETTIRPSIRYAFLCLNK